MSDLTNHSDRLNLATEKNSFSSKDISSAVQNDNGRTAIGDSSDNHIFKTPQLSKEELAQLGFSADVPMTDRSTPSNSLAEQLQKFEQEQAKAKGGASVDGVTSSGEPIWKDPTSGWDKVGPGQWEKNTPLPKNWDNMTPDERAQFIKGIEGKDADQFMLVGPDGSARTGWHKDPRSGEYFWMGYAGEEPKGPPPFGGNSHYYQ